MNKNTATFNMKARGQLETADTCIDSVKMSTCGLLQMHGVSILQQMKSVSTVQLQRSLDCNRKARRSHSSTRTTWTRS